MSTRRVARRTRSERGTSLLEAMITVTMLAAAMATMMAAFTSLTRAVHHNEQRSDAERSMNLSLDTVLRDLRAAEGVMKPTSTHTAASELIVRVPTDSGTASTVRFGLTDDDRSFVRQELDENNKIIAQRVIVASVIDARESVFRYFTSGGTEMQAGTIDAETIQKCTVRVRITLRAPIENGESISSSTDVAFRNVRPEQVVCP